MGLRERKRSISDFQGKYPGVESILVSEIDLKRVPQGVHQNFNTKLPAFYRFNRHQKEGNYLRKQKQNVLQNQIKQI